MHVMYFTERPYRYVPNDEVIKTGFFGIPNKHFDSVKGGQLLNEYLDEKLLAEELGFDGVMLNALSELKRNIRQFRDGVTDADFAQPVVPY